MRYIFLIVAAVWSIQFLLSYWQLRRFHQRLAELRKLGRCSVGMSGSRWQGRTYGVLVLDEHERVRHAASFSGWTVFSTLQPITGLEGMRPDAILSTGTPLIDLRRSDWLALQHAARFFRTSSPSNRAPSPIAPSERQT